MWLVDAQRASGGDAVVCGGALVRGWWYCSGAALTGLSGCSMPALVPRARLGVDNGPSEPEINVVAKPNREIPKK